MMHLNNRINFNLRILYFVAFCLFCVTWIASSSEAISCDSCGRECSSACGTKHFRTCCFNYLRKRSVPLPMTQTRYDSINQKPPTAFQFELTSSNSMIIQEILDDLLNNIKDLNHLIETYGKLNSSKIPNKKQRLISTEENQIDYP